MFIAKIDAVTGFDGELKSFENNSLLIYANPNTGKCNIIVPDEFVNEQNLVLGIFSITGQLIRQQKLVMSEDKIFLDLEAEAKGIYTATLSNGKKTYTGKIIFE